MPQESDVLVIGGGAVGVCTAYYLAKAGRQVTLIEKGKICSGCSYGNACMIVPSHAMPIPAPGVIKKSVKWLFKEDSPLLIRFRPDWELFSWLWRFAVFCRDEPMRRSIPILRDLGRASLILFKELEATEGISFDFKQQGLMYVYSTEEGFEEGKEEAALLAQYDLPSRVLTGIQAQELEPALRDTVVGALYFPEDAHGSSFHFVRGMAEVIKKLGVAVETDTEVVGWLMDGKRPIGVKTSRGGFHGREIVLATGSWTPQLTRPIGLNVPVQPGKGYSLTMDRPPVCPEIPLIHFERKIGVTPIGNRLRFAGTMEFAGFDLSLNRIRAEAIQRGAMEVLPAISNPGNVEHWCGLRPCTPDGLPIIDRLPNHPNIYLCTGHAMLGYTQSPISGKLISEMITGQSLSTSVEALTVRRF